MDALGNAYVADFNSDNAFKITHAGVITEIIDAADPGETRRRDLAAWMEPAKPVAVRGDPEAWT